MNKTNLAVLLGLLYFQIVSVDAMELNYADDARKEQQEEKEAWLSSMETQQDYYKREKEKEQVKRSEALREALLELIAQEKTAPDNDATKEQGAQIAVCLDLQRPKIKYIYDLSDNPSRGDTQLHASIRQGTQEGRTAASQLLQNGFDVDHTSCMLGHTALHVATSSLDPIATQLLLESGALAQNTVNGLSALHLAVWAAIGTPIVASESVQTMLLAMRSTQVVELSKEEHAAQARQVITLLLTHIPKSLISKQVAIRTEYARALCNQKIHKTNQSASEMAAQSGDQELADLCNPDKLHQHYQKIKEEQEKIIAKKQGAQIAVCLMRAPSSMPIPKKHN